MKAETIQWLLTCDEPWTRYRALVDLLDQPEHASEVQEARAAMLAHPRLQGLIATAARWGERPLRRHNDASHTIYAFSTLADFGVRGNDPGVVPIIEAVVSHQSAEGAFQTPVSIPKAFGGTDEEAWAWIACDAPTLLYGLSAMGLTCDPRVQRATAHLADLVEENGWRCTAAPELGKFKGPGRKSDPCPIANVYALKALSLDPDLCDSPIVDKGAEMLLWHWAHQRERKLFLFGIGSDFRKLKYPFIWYDILHVVEALSRFSSIHNDPGFREMVETITAQADTEGQYTATSMYRAWKGWSFADKSRPSPWLTFLVLRVLKRMGGSTPSKGMIG